MGEQVRRAAAFALPLCAGLVVARALGAGVLAVYDDAYITLRYARNLWEGQGFVYHAGEWVLGTTAPAFGLLQTVFFALGLPQPETLVVLNVLCDAAILFYVASVFARADQTLAALAFAGLYIASPIVTRICVGGMESELFGLGLVLAVGLYSTGRSGSAVVLASLLCFVRPEAVLLVAVFGLITLAHGRAAPVARLVGISLACVLPVLAILYALYGTVIPASVAAKSADPGNSLAQVARMLLAPDALSALVLPLALFGAWAARRERFPATLALFAVLYALAYAIARPHVWSWYAAPLQLSFLILAARGLAEAVARMLPRALVIAEENRMPLAVGVALLGVVLWTGVRVVSGPSPVRAHVRVPVAAFAENELSADSTVLAIDIGMIGYYSGSRIYDAAGLVWPAARDFTSWTEIASTHSPDYIYLTAHRRRIAELVDSGLDESYKPVARFSRFGHSDRSLDPSSYPDHWTQDYLVLKLETPEGGQ